MLRVGTVGTSSIMRTIQEAIRLTDGMECRVVYSRTEEQGRAFAAEMGVPEHCTDYAAMLERSDLDLIIWEYVLVNRHIEHRNKLDK